ncbi:hypothetical protein G5B10_07665 [Fluviicola sp. SGL-29]|nr:hypothetical protein [Fluviicola sp. SGL-29]
MKKIIYSLAIGLISYSASSQLNYVDIDWVIDQTASMSNNEVDTLGIDIDQDGTKDLRISSWSNHTVGESTVIEVLLLQKNSNELFYGLQTTINNCNYLKDCPGTPNYNHSMGYIYTSNICGSNPYANEYVKFPFRFQGVSGTHCGFLYVRYVGTTITIEGYAWNPTPEGSCSCSTSGWLTLEKPGDIEFDLGEFKYYNMMGQEVENPSGLVLKVYENGSSKKVYIQN